MLSTRSTTRRAPTEIGRGSFVRGGGLPATTELLGAKEAVVIGCGRHRVHRGRRCRGLLTSATANHLPCDHLAASAERHSTCGASQHTGKGPTTSTSGKGPTTCSGGGTTGSGSGSTGCCCAATSHEGCCEQGKSHGMSPRVVVSVLPIISRGLTGEVHQQQQKTPVQLLNGGLRCAGAAYSYPEISASNP